MNMIFGDPEHPPTDAEMRRVNKEFDDCHRAFLERKSSYRSPHTIERGDLASRVAMRFDDAYRRIQKFRIFVQTHGMMAVRKHEFFGAWLSWEISDQFLRHYGAMPRLTTYPQNAWLRLALLHTDGYLFPIVSNKVTEEERQLLSTLEQANKVFAVATDEGVGVWSVHPTLGTMTLHPSDQHRGGDDDLKLLVQRGYFEKLPTRDPLMRWCIEENVMFTLRVTETGRAYINALASGALIVSTDAVTPGDADEIPDDEGKNIPDDTPDAESHVDEVRFRAWMKGKSLGEVVIAAVATGVIKDPLDGYIFWMRWAGNSQYSTLEQVAQKVGLSTSSVQRREEKVAYALGVLQVSRDVPRGIKNDPEKVQRYREKVQQKLEKIRRNSEKVQQNLEKLRDYLDQNSNARSRSQRSR